jgi:FkbM family methyltransferase
MVIATLRRLRHGPLRSLDPMWVALGRLYRWLFRVLGVHRPVTSRIGPYGPFRLDGMFVFSNFENWGGGHNDAFELAVEACRGKRCVLDVGAHIGLVALPMASVVGAQGRVVCFEPAQANRKLLMEHAALNGLSNIEVVSALVGAEPLSAVRFFEMDKPTGMNTMAVPKNPKGYHESQCRQISLDSFCTDRGIVPDVIKIDVEGAEIGVLRGARDVLRRFRPLIFLSVHPREIAGLNGSIGDLISLVAELGYELRDTKGREPARLELREYVLTPRQTRVATFR